MIRTISIPYYTSSMDLHVEEKNLKTVITAKTEDYVPEKSPKELIEDALEHPIGTPKLSELAKGKNEVVLVTSDHTRAVPSRLTLPILLNEIRKGNPDADIIILIATGLHRETTEEEQRRMFGDDIVDHEKISVNHAFQNEEFAFVRELPSGAELWVNRLALGCDLLVTEGFIEPHFFAGFSGGRKSILPGICNAATVNENHSYKAISSPFSTTGVLEHNPIHEDMVCAARAVNVHTVHPECGSERREAGDCRICRRSGTGPQKRGFLRAQSRPVPLHHRRSSARYRELSDISTTKDSASFLST